MAVLRDDPWVHAFWSYFLSYKPAAEAGTG